MRKYEVWSLPAEDLQVKKHIDKLISDLKVSRVMAHLLVNRGILEPQDARIFLDAGYHQLSDPFLIPGMDKAVERLIQAIDTREKIFIYGDYDADGICSVSILKQCLDLCVPEVEYYIPHRFQEGYGLNCEAVKRIGSQGGQLIITVDCGISSIEEVKLANDIGIDVVITDHHEPSIRLPEAVAVVNPKLAEGHAPNELAGAGVVFQLVRALADKYPKIEPEKWLDIVAIATVADIVPLLGDNRILVREGLKKLQQTRRPGLRSLIEVAGLADRELGVNQIGFALAPRLNAAGRMGEVQTAVNLLLAEDEQDAVNIAEDLDRLNRRRQEIEAEIYREACLEAESHVPQGNKVLILGKDDWHQGVIGIVASKLADLYGLPTILIAWEGETGRGSGRSIPGFDLYQAMDRSQTHLEKFGGHQQAAGITIRRDQLADFSRTMNEVAAVMTEEMSSAAELTTDCEVSAGEITMGLVKEIRKAEPFGTGNPKPRLVLRRVNVLNRTVVGKKQEHFKFKVSDNGLKLDAIAFGLGDACGMIEDKELIDLVFEPDINDFRGKVNIQLVVRDLKASRFPDRGISGDDTDQPGTAAAFVLAESSIKQQVECGNPVIVVYPSIRCLEKHLPGLRNLVPENLLMPIHGRTPKGLRARQLENIAAENFQIVLTTETFFQYYIYNLDFVRQCHKVVFWPGKPFGSIMLSEPKAVICFGLENIPQIRRVSKSSVASGHKLAYANRKKTVQETARRCSGLVEAGLNCIADRARLRGQFLAQEEGCLLWDGVFGGGLPVIRDCQVWFEDAPFGSYEINSILEQVGGRAASIDLRFADESLEFNRAYLGHLYPDQGSVWALYDNLHRQNGSLRISALSLRGEAADGPGALKELRFSSSLQILNDLDLCEYVLKNGWYEINVIKSAQDAIDLERSPFYREGLAEKQIFEEFVTMIEKY
ncbi:MAG: single-stranded-DNA-specific exonuclease RecJ [Ignavibacteriales bacterium]